MGGQGVGWHGYGERVEQRWEATKSKPRAYGRLFSFQFSVFSVQGGPNRVRAYGRLRPGSARQAGSTRRAAGSCRGGPAGVLGDGVDCQRAVLFMRSLSNATMADAARSVKRVF